MKIINRCFTWLFIVTIIIQCYYSNLRAQYYAGKVIVLIIHDYEITNESVIIKLKTVMFETAINYQFSSVYIRVV